MFVCKVAGVLFIAFDIPLQGFFICEGGSLALSYRFCLSVCVSVPEIIHIACVCVNICQDNCILSQIDISLCSYVAKFLTDNSVVFGRPIFDIQYYLIIFTKFVCVHHKHGTIFR